MNALWELIMLFWLQKIVLGVFQHQKDTSLMLQLPLASIKIFAREAFIVLKGQLQEKQLFVRLEHSAAFLERVNSLIVVNAQLAITVLIKR